MGKGKEQSQTTTPWSGQQPHLNRLYGGARAAYTSGGPQYFPGSTVAPFSPQQQLGFDMATRRATQGGPHDRAQTGYINSTLGMSNGSLDWENARQAAGQVGAASSALKGAGRSQFLSTGKAQSFAGRGQDEYLNQMKQYNSTNNPALNRQLNKFAGQANKYGAMSSLADIANNDSANPFQKNFRSMAGGSGDNKYIGQVVHGDFGGAKRSLAGTANGQFLGGNPYLADIYRNTSRGIVESFTDGTMPALNASFGSAGRAGGGLRAMALGTAAGDTSEAIGDVGAQIYGNAYESERGRMVQAAGTLGGLNNQSNIAGAQLYGDDQNRRLSAAQGGAAVYDSSQNRRLNAANSLAGHNLNAAGMGANVYSKDRSLGLQANSLALNNRFNRQQLAGSLHNQAKSRQLQSGSQLASLGLGGINAQTGMWESTARAKEAASAAAQSANSNAYRDISMINQVGGQIQGQSQRLLDDQRNRFDFYQQAPYQGLRNYTNTLAGLGGGYGTTTSSGAGGSRGAGVLGGALAGAATGSQINLGWGTAAGALIGGMAAY